ncbi:hypothetical protein HHX47_DHR6000522 [Lentinula edodes]|nr:hypothetical protein HHX47_DHR6000522 [Lentinula edodes]
MKSTIVQHVSAAQQQQLEDYFHLFSITFLYWDHLITFQPCASRIPRPSDAVMLRSIQVAAAWEALFLYDSMLFVMTLHKAYKTRYELRQERLRIPLVVIILRDGR